MGRVESPPSSFFDDLIHLLNRKVANALSSAKLVFFSLAKFGAKLVNLPRVLCRCFILAFGFNIWLLPSAKDQRWYLNSPNNANQSILVGLHTFQLTQKSDSVHTCGLDGSDAKMKCTWHPCPPNLKISIHRKSCDLNELSVEISIPSVCHFLSLYVEVSIYVSQCELLTIQRDWKFSTNRKYYSFTESHQSEQHPVRRVHLFHFIYVVPMLMRFKPSQSVYDL